MHHHLRRGHRAQPDGQPLRVAVSRPGGVCLVARVQHGLHQVRVLTPGGEERLLLLLQHPRDPPAVELLLAAHLAQQAHHHRRRHGDE